MRKNSWKFFNGDERFSFISLQRPKPYWCLCSTPVDSVVVVEVREWFPFLRKLIVSIAATVNRPAPCRTWTDAAQSARPTDRNIERDTDVSTLLPRWRVDSDWRSTKNPTCSTINPTHSEIIVSTAFVYARVINWRSFSRVRSLKGEEKVQKFHLVDTFTDRGQIAFVRRTNDVQNQIDLFDVMFSGENRSENEKKDVRRLIFAHSFYLPPIISARMQPTDQMSIGL